MKIFDSIFYSFYLTKDYIKDKDTPVFDAVLFFAFSQVIYIIELSVFLKIFGVYIIPNPIYVSYFLLAIIIMIFNFMYFNINKRYNKIIQYYSNESEVEKKRRIKFLIIYVGASILLPLFLGLMHDIF